MNRWQVSAFRPLKALGKPVGRIPIEKRFPLTSCKPGRERPGFRNQINMNQ